METVIFTFNVNGLGLKEKREKALKFLKVKAGKAIYMLQETHSTENNKLSWANEMSNENNVCFKSRGIERAWYGNTF